jgi:hypothetical protein
MFRLHQNSPSVKRGSFRIEKARLVVNLETQEDSMEQRQFMKALESGAFGQDQAHSLAMVIFGQMGLEVGGSDMVWTSFALAPVHEETVV